MTIESLNFGPITEACGPDCPAFVAKWSDWWAEKTREPVALCWCDDTYLQRIGGKSRNMVSKATRLYEYGRIERSDHLDEIERVARSKPVRQGIPMKGWYTESLAPEKQAQLCGLHADEWHAGFRRDNGMMVCFAAVKVFNELAILNSILGDPEAGAAMNGLVAHLVETLGVTWINYLFPGARTKTLADFKRRVGFEAVTVR